MKAGEEIIIFDTYSDPVLAHIIRARFEDNDIPSFVDENMSHIYPLYNTAMGGVKLKIFAKDLELAQTLAAKDDSLSVEELTADDVDLATETTCPHC